MNSFFLYSCHREDCKDVAISIILNHSLFGLQDFTDSYLLEFEFTGLMDLQNGLEQSLQRRNAFVSNPLVHLVITSLESEVKRVLKILSINEDKEYSLSQFPNYSKMLLVPYPSNSSSNIQIRLLKKIICFKNISCILFIFILFQTQMK